MPKEIMMARDACMQATDVRTQEITVKMLKRVITAVLLYAVHLGGYADTVEQSSAFALLGEPKYRAVFHHFDYVNPDAPKGGSITLSALGTFDNFNRYALRGVAAARTERLYDSLFTTSDDEPGSYYPLVALTSRHSPDFSWVEIDMNPRAHFHDGSPMTAADVAFTYNMFMTQGVPQFRLYFKGAIAIAVAPLTVRFEFPQPDKNRMFSLLTLPIMPEKFWKNHNLAEPLAYPPPASGPYRVTAYRTGQYVTYSRVQDYWGADLPVNKGQYNFDKIRYDYYLDDSVALEAFRAGAFDLRIESSPKHWATQYKGGNFTRGYIIKRDQENQSAQNTRWLAFNIQRPLFSDRRVRQALTLAFDFNWMNKALFYNAYQHADSYFQNTEYAAQGKPSPEELVWLTPLKDKVPPEVFGPRYQPPSSDGNGYDREHWLTALKLLEEAGWVLKDQKLVNRQTGKPFTFELLLPSAANSLYVLPFQHNLKKLGITMNIRNIDSAQFNSRLRNRDFDMTATLYQALLYPTDDLQMRWHSQYIDSTYNTSGVRDPAIDSLIDEITRHQGQKAPLLSLGRALDRVLTWNQFMIPMWYSNHDRFAYWNKFAMPAIPPAYSLGFDSWWYDVKQAATLPAERR
ncbi:microcin C transport system substrate-binding protein|uniref:Microcin C transport system substrate-binding protein n=2 Tax=Brenneria salicis TaxID=55214 RepID=A0A366HZ29_9GAMM|nr:microcin C transport system substrate-binding protein [Brenneria salicis ATCC 15712 = DSM 30166]RBP59468.1 microcin C transport system substrate-binding protein [Brenneria salicis ATCC 15712 = DSM 30166]